MDSSTWELRRDQDAVQLDGALNALDEDHQLVELECVHELDQALGLLSYLDSVVVL